MSTPTDFIASTIADLPPFLLVAEVANTLRLSRRTVSRYVAEGRLRVLKTAEGSGAGRVLIPRGEVERFLRGLVSP